MPFCSLHKQSYAYGKTCSKCTAGVIPSLGPGPLPKSSSLPVQLQTAQLEFVQPLNFPNHNGDYTPLESLGLPPSPSSLAKEKAPLTVVQESARHAGRGAWIASGSYKQAYKLADNGMSDVLGKVLIVTSKDKRKALEDELRNLEVLRAKGVRVLRVFGQVDDVSNTEIGVLVENMAEKTEVKETTFGTSKSQTLFKEAAKQFGADKLVAQLQAIQTFMTDRQKGIGDLQFFVGNEIGCVLFDPLRLDAEQINGGVLQMIKALKKAYPEAFAHQD